MTTDFEDSPPTIDRRALLKAGVWAAPVLVIAAAAPAAAASIPDATGQLDFTNTSHYWAYGPGGVTGLTANTTIGFGGGGTGTLESVTLVAEIENADNQYLVGGAPVIRQGAPSWTAVGTGTAITVGGQAWIRYTFMWTGTLLPGGYTSLLEATVPLTAALPSPPPGSPWTLVASAPGTDVVPGIRSGTGAEVLDPGPPPP